MKFSIIIPVYNVEKYLKKLLDSILEQSYTNYEVILVDDGSSDGSYDIMKEYANNNSVFKIFHKKNEGPGLTRKYGYNHSSGDLLFFVDSDDCLAHADVLKRINDVFVSNDIDLLLFETKKCPDDGIINKVIMKKSFERGKYDIFELNDCIVEGSLCMKIFKRELFEEDFFYNSNNFEDVYTTYKYLNNCHNFYYLDEVCYIVNRLEENFSLTKVLNLDKFIRSIDIIMEINNFSKLNISVKLMALNYYMYSIRMMFKSKENLKKKMLLLNKLKKLKRFFRKDVKYLCKNYFRKEAYYVYLFLSIFI